MLWYPTSHLCFQQDPALGKQAPQQQQQYRAFDLTHGLYAGEDVGHYGGSYKVTYDLYKKYGDMRVLDTPICGEFQMLAGKSGSPGKTANSTGSPVVRGNSGHCIVSHSLH